MNVAATPATGWDCHVHVFDAAAPVRPGHYVPGHHTLPQIVSLAEAHGVGRLVLVQPSVYGTDHTVLLRALAEGRGRHRGVAVVDADVRDDEVERLHAAGVRGVRFNLVSPAGHQGDPGPTLQALAPRLRRLGWHVQWYVPADALPRVAAWQAATGLVFVLDHLAGLHAALPAHDRAWPALRDLAAGGAWVKLSGWYRLGADAPYAALHGHIGRVAAAFPSRTVWGSDWPHTGRPPGSVPGLGDLMGPVRAALGDDALAAAVHVHPALLYDGPVPAPGGTRAT